jgi:hypothetical protein
MCRSLVVVKGFRGAVEGSRKPAGLTDTTAGSRGVDCAATPAAAGIAAPFDAIRLNHMHAYDCWLHKLRHCLTARTVCLHACVNVSQAYLASCRILLTGLVVVRKV